jgi:hypothetical protein
MLIFSGKTRDNSNPFSESCGCMGGIVDGSAIHDFCASRGNNRILGIVTDRDEIVVFHNENS